MIVDSNTFDHCLPEVVAAVQPLEQAEFVEVPVGEDCKSVEIASQVWQAMIESGADRNSVVVAVGGGAVCDLAGFVAAGYERGVRLVNIPTSLIAMADAAIGGKTAVNLGGVKNPVGFFKMADIVCVEPSLLASLPKAELKSGAFEVVKTAAVADPELFSELIGGALEPFSAQAITCVAEIKQAIVKADPKDHDIRHILNFGHTFGHAIEAYSVHGGMRMSHGVAVGIGMAMAMRLSVLKLGLAREVYDSYCQYLTQRIEFPQYTLRDAEQMLPLIHHDKKCAGGQVLAVLLRKPGEAVIDVALSDNELLDTLLSGMAL
ncbi:MAG: 3-dehydroquinate synthase [Bacteroidales bacterium]|nr:3-dehydroquinate synthase [Bacteroidales bacterium]